MTVSETVRECNPPEVPTDEKPSELEPAKRRPVRPALTDEARARSKAATALRSQVRKAARLGAEALLAQHPGILEADVGELSRLAAARIATDLVAGNVPGSQIHYAAQAVRTLVEVSRLEEGKPTDVTARITADAGELAAMLEQVRRQSRSVLPSADSAPGEGG